MIELDSRIVVGTKVKMKKAHPCGKSDKTFMVYYIGNRIELQCVGCAHRMFLDREKFIENLEEIIE